MVDTNFINLSLENRIDLVKAMMDALYAKGELLQIFGAAEGRFNEANPPPSLRRARELTLLIHFTAIPCISDCVLAELEKLGQKYRLALR